MAEAATVSRCQPLPFAVPAPSQKLLLSQCMAQAHADFSTSSQAPRQAHPDVSAW